MDIFMVKLLSPAACVQRRPAHFKAQLLPSFPGCVCFPSRQGNTPQNLHKSLALVVKKTILYSFSPLFPPIRSFFFKGIAASAKSCQNSRVCVSVCASVCMALPLPLSFFSQSFLSGELFSTSTNTLQIPAGPAASISN